MSGQVTPEDALGAGTAGRRKTLRTLLARPTSYLRRADTGARSAVLAGIVVAVASLWLLTWGLLAHLTGVWTSSPGLASLALVLGLMAAPALAAFVVSRRYLAIHDHEAQELRTAHDRYRGFFNDASEIFLVCDTHGRIQLINPAGIRALGVDPSWEKLSLSDLVAPEEAHLVASMLSPSAPAGERTELQLQLLNWNGGRIAVDVEAVALGDPGEGRLLRCCARGVAVADRDLETQARESDLELETLIQQFPEGVALLSSDGRVLLANRSGEAYLSEYGTFIAERRLVLFGGMPLEVLLTDHSNGRRQEIVVREPYHQILEVYAQRMTGGGSGRSLVIIRDVTAERQRRQRLERSDRLAAVGQLAAGIAHDFKNILQGINLCAELSRTDSLSPAENKDSMLTIIEQAHRGSKLIQQIMDFTRQSESTQRLIDLGDLVRETSELLAPGIPENIELEVEIADGEHPAMADPGQIQQAIANLALNARDAMPTGGRLTISLGRVGGAGDSAPLPPEVERGDWHRIAIKDTGIGIPRSVQHRVFEPFFTTKTSSGGTGLGLAQVYGNVQQHGGHIEFETREGAGTTFFLFLPAYRYHTGKSSDQPAATIYPRGAGETVLVVEDEIAVLTATSQSLRSLGYRVLEAADSTDALRLFQIESPVHLVLTDVRMPGMDGLGLVAELKRRDPQVKVLVMTGYAAQLADPGEVPEGADGLLTKPFSMAHLATEVKRTLLSLAEQSDLGGDG